MNNTKKTLFSMTLSSLELLDIFSDSIGVSRSKFLSGLILGEYQVRVVEGGYVLYHYGRFVPEWNIFFDEEDFHNLW